MSRPVYALDCESTGTNPATARIVQIAVCEVVDAHDDVLVTDDRTRLVNPGIPIPPEATEVHGITDEHVADAAPFARIARSLADALDGADLIGFGIARCDVPLLEAEFRRAGIEWEPSGAVVDALTIYHKHEPRDLEAAVARYYPDLTPTFRAHDAAEDARAALRVFYAQAAEYGLPLDLDEVEQTYRDPSWVDRQGKLRRDGDAIVLGFGKHAGRALEDVVRTDCEYLSWLLGADFAEDVKRPVREKLGVAS